MATTFAAGLSAHLNGKPKLSRLDRRILKIVDGPPSAMRTWFLKRLEEGARLKLGVSATPAIDWGSIDWNKVLDLLMKLISLILMLAPLFAAEKPETKAKKAKPKTLAPVSPKSIAK